MNSKLLKISGFVLAASLSGGVIAGENVAQSNIAAIYQPSTPAASGTAPVAGSVSLLDSEVRKWRDPSRDVSVNKGPVEQTTAAMGNVAQEKLKSIFSAYAAS